MQFETTQTRFKSVIVVLLPFVLFIIHGTLFGNWIIDDAAISFVYSKNLSSGYGLVSQPGAEPVEAYSNFTWIILFVPFFIFKIFNPIIIPKIVGGIIVLMSFIIIYRLLFLTSKHYYIGTTFILILLASHTSFTAWTISGLENPLYVFLTLLLAYQLVKLNSQQIETLKIVILAVLVGLTAMTRPDGILYVAVLPAMSLFSHIFWKRPIKTMLIEIGIYVIVLIFVYGGFGLFRFYYFEDLLPNTFYAKGGFTMLGVISQAKIYGLFYAVAWHLGIPLLVALIAATIYLVHLRKFNRSHLVILLMLICATSIYLLLPDDWMGEYRFATPFLVFIYLYIFLIAETLFENLKTINKLFIPLACLFIGTSIIFFASRTQQFINDLPASFQKIGEAYGNKFNEYADKLKITDGSLLLPDIGGALYYSNLRVYDLGGLADKTIARTLGKRQEAFYDYIFEAIKPTFIHTHGWWSYIANFDKDERFRRDYVAIQESLDKWVMNTYGVQVYSGNYVRRDVLENQNDKLELL